jgi:hypothetical protein
MWVRVYGDKRPRRVFGQSGFVCGHLFTGINVPTDTSAIRTNEQWLKAIGYPLLKPVNPEQRGTVRWNSPTPDKLASGILTSVYV